MTKKKEPEAPAAALPVTYTRSEQIVRQIVDAGDVSVGAKIVERVEREAIKRTRPRVTVGIEVAGDPGGCDRSGQRFGEGLFEVFLPKNHVNRHNICDELQTLAKAIGKSMIDMRGSATILVLYSAGEPGKGDA